jgi:hypothetical protein
VVNDFFNGNKRLWKSEMGEKQITFEPSEPGPGKKPTTSVTLGSKWVNLDGRLGIVQMLPEGGPFVLSEAGRRNAPFGSLHYDVLNCPQAGDRPRSFGKGEVILHTRFLLVAGDAERTAALAAEAP